MIWYDFLQIYRLGKVIISLSCILYFLLFNGFNTIRKSIQFSTSNMVSAYTPPSRAYFPPSLFFKSPSDSIDSTLSVSNLLHLLTIKLTSSNYFVWKKQILPLLSYYNQSGYVDGLIPAPPPTIVTQASASTPNLH